MSVSKKYETKYKEIIDALRLVLMEDHEIEERLYVMELLEGYTALTVNELLSLSETQLDNVLSVCWLDGRHRCNSLGVRDVQYNNNRLSWSDNDGDTRIHLDSDREIKKVGDGEWDYGLYIKK